MRPLCTLESMQEELDSLSQRIEDTKVRLKYTSSERDKAARISQIKRLTIAASDLKRGLSSVMSEFKKAEKKVSELKSVETQAKSKLGGELSDLEFGSLSQSDRLLHTEMRQKVITDPKHQLFSIRRFLRTIQNAPMYYPISTRVTKYSSHPQKALRVFDVELQKYGLKIESDKNGGFTIFDKKAGADGKVRNIHSDTYAEASLKADQLLLSRSADGNMRLPGQPGISTPGPNAPKIIPLGRERSDGTRIDFTDGERHNISHPIPENNATSSTPRFNIFSAAWHQHVSKFIPFITKLDAEYKRITGKKQNLPLFDKVISTARKVEEAHGITERFTKQIFDLASKHKISWDHETGNRLLQFANFRDNQQEAIWQAGLKSGSTPQQLRLDQIQSKAAITKLAQDAFPNVSKNEIAFLDDLHDHMMEVGRFIGVPEDQLRIFFMTRANRALETYKVPMDVLQSDQMISGFWGIKQRTRSSLLESTDPMLKELQDFDAMETENIASSKSIFDALSAYIRSGVRRRIAGEALDDAMRELKPELVVKDENLLIEQGMLVGNMRVHSWIVDRLRKDLQKFAGIPSREELMSTSKRRNVLKTRMAKIDPILKDLETHALSNPLVKVISNPLRTYYNKLGVRVSQPHIEGVLDTFARLHRGKTFGLNIMAAVRDKTGVDFLAWNRFDPKDYAEVWSMLNLNPRYVMKEYIRQNGMSWVRNIDDILAAPELQRQIQANPGMKHIVDALRQGKLPEGTGRFVLDSMQLFYRLGEMHQHMFINKLSEHATIKAFDVFKKSARSEKDLDNFLIRTGVAYSSDAWAGNVKEKLFHALDNDNLVDLVDTIRLMNREETITLFNRWNSSPYMESAIGRAFMQYGSWSVGLISSMYHSATAPWKVLSNKSTAAKAQAIMALKYAIGAEAIYTLAGAFNIDSSDWIPSPSNALFFGSPQVTIFQDVRELFSGDPAMIQRFQKDPILMMSTLARQAQPIIPTTLQRSLGQYFGEDLDSYQRKLFGFPPQMDSSQDQLFVSLGFSPLTKPLYPSFRRGGLAQLGWSETVGRLQDMLSAGPIPPGTQDALRDFEPLIRP